MLFINTNGKGSPLLYKDVLFTFHSRMLHNATKVTLMAEKEKETSAFRVSNCYASVGQLLVILNSANTIIAKSELINL